MALIQKSLRELLSYDPMTGQLTWLVNRGRVHVGEIAGSLDSRGYRVITIDGKNYKAHRLAWLYVNGAWPADRIDHQNGVPDDNRIANLREATDAENGQNRTKQANNKSGFLGVSWHKPSGQWVAQIMLDGRKSHLGYFPTPEAAYAAYLTAKSQLHTFNPKPREAAA